MKEFRSRNSGRYIFNEDIHNLQNLALSMTEMFKDSGVDFVISGCGITVTQDNGVYTVSVGSGFVFLDNKVREVAAFTGTTSAINTIGLFATTPVAPQITYVSGDTDYQYNDFAAEVRLNSEETNGRLLAVLDGGVYKFPNLKTGYFAHYCILNNGTAGHLDSLVAGEIDVTTLKIGGTNVNSLFVKKAGDTMNNGATLTFTNGSKNTVIGPASLSVGGSISGETLSLSGAASVGGNLTAAAIIKSGGLSTEFLKADGSVDDTDYATSDDLAGYLPLTGGTLTGNLTCNVNLNVSGNASVLGNITVSTNLNVQGTISGVNETLTGNLNAKDGTFTGDINAHDGTFTGELVADSAEITNGFTAGTITVNGVATIGGALTTSSTATIGGDTTVSGEVTATKFIKTGGTASQFLKADGSVDSNAYITASAAIFNNYLLLTGGNISSDEMTTYLSLFGNQLVFGSNDDSASLQLNSAGLLYIDSNGIQSSGAVIVSNSVTASSFVKSGGTSSQFLKADGSVDSNSYVTTASAANFATTSDLNNYVLKSGGEISSSDGISSLALAGGGIILRRQQHSVSLSVSYGSMLIVSGAIHSDDAIFCKSINMGENYPVALAVNSAGGLTINSDVIVNNSVQAASFVKAGGTSSQVLMADGGVTALSDLVNYIPNAGITTSLLASEAVTTAKIADGAITSAKLASGLLSDYFSKNGDTISDGSGHSLSISSSGIEIRSNQYSTQLSLAYGTVLGVSGGIKAQGEVLCSYLTIGSSGSSIIISVNSSNELAISNSVVVSGSVTATSFPTSSDARLKVKVSDIMLSAQQIAEAPAINFMWKDSKDNGVHAGTIAQYWQEILPAVIMNRDDHFVMDYGPAAMVAVISLAKEVVSLKQEIERLKQ